MWLRFFDELCGFKIKRNLTQGRWVRQWQQEKLRNVEKELKKGNRFILRIIPMSHKNESLFQTVASDRSFLEKIKDFLFCVKQDQV